MSGRTKVAMLVAAGVLVLAISIPALAHSNGSTASSTDSTTGSDHSVTVSGSAVVTSKPDEAVISLGVQTQAQTASDALRQNAAKMSAVVDAITGAGIDRSDISTDSVNLSPQTNNNGTEVIGYIAQNSVSVTVRDLPKAGPVIDAANGAGANIVNGISFQVSQQNPALTDALGAAVKDSKARAEAMAAAAGATVGSVVSMSDQTVSQPVPFAYDKFAAAGAATPIEPGTISTTVSVTVVWALQ
jgi:uncharacterized protein